MSEKVTGYILLVVGVITILLSAVSVYMVFTKQSKPVQLFNFEGIAMDMGLLLPADLPTSARPANTKAELIPPKMLNDSSNIFAHLFLMGFIASAGFKLAQLGTYLVRPIVVKLKAKETTS